MHKLIVVHRLSLARCRQ